MRARSLGALLAATAITACGSSAAPTVPDAIRVPLLPGSRVTTQVRDCDTGANAFCALELVVVNPSYGSSLDLLKAEQIYLKTSGWFKTGGDNGLQTGEDSPDHKLRLTYTTAQDDLQGIVLGWIKRPHEFALALSNVMFARSSALSMMVEAGSQQ
jgi:hypothetical protein